MTTEIFDRERDRLNRRIHYVRNTLQCNDTSNAIRQYRRDINKREAILARGVRAFPYTTPRGTRFRAADELKLCHKFLDTYRIPAMES